MKTASESHAQPTELLIAEARQHQRWRYVRSIVVAIVAALALAIGVGVFSILSQRSTGGREGGAPFATARASAASACRTFWAESATLRNQTGRDQSPPPSFSLPPYVVGDVGEHDAALLFVGSGGYDECFVKMPASVASVVGVGGSPDGTSSRTPSAAYPITLSSPALFTAFKAKFQEITGQAAPGVRSITLELSDGTTVHPALGHGYFIAWWPGTATVVSSTFVAHGLVHHAGGAPSSQLEYPGTAYRP